MLQVALAGNPNTGKTTLFNALTGARAHVGNYPGITVEHRHGERVTRDGQRWRVHDLPGCYSLSAHSPEEEIAHHALTGRVPGVAADVVVAVLDATNLSRNLLLLLQIAELGKPMVAAVNMMDAARAEGLLLDLPGLGQALGCPVVGVVARSGQGLDELERAVHEVAAAAPDARGPGRVPPTHWPAEVTDAVRRVKAVLATRLPGHADPAAISDGEALWWLACDREVADGLQPGLGAALEAAVPRPAEPERDVRRLVTRARFERIDALLGRHLRRTAGRGESRSARIDRWALHPVVGSGLFLLAMAVLFQAVFFWANPAIEAVEATMAAAAGLATDLLPAGLLRDVMVDGVLAGVGGTLVFLPQILMLFLGIALLEDTGYLARTAFLVDRLMARVGLPGKAFVPLLSSFACNVPGILAARTMSDPRDRLLTILVAPLMSCSARLPVYTLVTAAVFSGTAPVLGILSFGGLVVTVMYGLGFLFALGTAAVLRRSAVRGGSAPLLLEMPPYRWPRAGNVARELWDRGRLFLTQTGTLIVALSVVLWALMTFPRVGLADGERAQRVAAVEASTAAGSPARAAALADVEHLDAQRRLENSVAGRMGRAIEPLIAPLGFDWRIGIGLIGSFAAREVLVPVLGQVYGRGSAADVDDRYASELGGSMVRAGALTPLKGLSLMVFFAIAMQCLSTVATIRRETASWRWPVFAVAYLNGLAWLASFAVYQGGRMLGYV